MLLRRRQHNAAATLHPSVNALDVADLAREIIGTPVISSMHVVQSNDPRFKVLCHDRPAAAADAFGGDVLT